MFCKFMKKVRMFKSPYMLATIGGLTAIVLDFVWSLAEVLHSVFGVDIILYVHIALLVGFPVCFGLLVYGAYKYFKNGYVRKEVLDELCHKKEEKRNKDVKKVLNSVDNK